MRFGKYLAIICVASAPIICVAADTQTDTDKAIATTKQAAKEWGAIAKQKLKQGEAAAKKKWPQVKEQTQQAIDNAKKKWNQSDSDQSQ